VDTRAGSPEHRAARSTTMRPTLLLVTATVQPAQQALATWRRAGCIGTAAATWTTGERGRPLRCPGPRTRVSCIDLAALRSGLACGGRPSQGRARR
jgi:hypothetical protein